MDQYYEEFIGMGPSMRPAHIPSPPQPPQPPPPQHSPRAIDEARRELAVVTQGEDSIYDYYVRCHRLCSIAYGGVEPKATDKYLIGQFIKGLPEPIRIRMKKYSINDLKDARKYADHIQICLAELDPNVESRLKNLEVLNQDLLRKCSTSDIRIEQVAENVESLKADFVEVKDLLHRLLDKNIKDQATQLSEDHTLLQNIGKLNEKLEEKLNKVSEQANMSYSWIRHLNDEVKLNEAKGETMRKILVEVMPKKVRKAMRKMAEAEEPVEKKRKVLRETIRETLTETIPTPPQTSSRETITPPMPVLLPLATWLTPRSSLSTPPPQCRTDPPSIETMTPTIPSAPHPRWSETTVDRSPMTNQWSIPPPTLGTIKEPRTTVAKPIVEEPVPRTIPIIQSFQIASNLVPLQRRSVKEMMRETTVATVAPTVAPAPTVASPAPAPQDPPPKPIQIKEEPRSPCSSPPPYPRGPLVDTVIENLKTTVPAHVLREIDEADDVMMAIRHQLQFYEKQATDIGEYMKHSPAPIRQSCVFCGQTSHHDYACMVVTNVQQRKKQLKDRGCCTECGKFHRGKCMKRQNCPICEKAQNDNFQLMLGTAHLPIVCPLQQSFHEAVATAGFLREAMQRLEWSFKG